MKIALAFFEQFINMSGGIERVCCNLANALAEKGYTVSIIYAYGKDGHPFYQLNPEIKLYNLMTRTSKKWKHNSLGKCVPPQSKLIREILRSFNKSLGRDYNESVKGRMIQSEISRLFNEITPDLIISFRYETSNYILNFAKTDIPLITMFHISPDIALKTAPKGELSAIEKSVYAQVLLPGDIEKVKTYCPKANVICIPNSVPQYNRQANLSAEKKAFKIINVARLNKAQKQQHLLIEAFANLASEFPEWTLEFWGGGDESQYPYRKELENLIEKKGLAAQVFLKGESRDILSEYVDADIFCLPSAYEGFPLSLTEAMSAGLPAVGFNTCPAVNELIEDHYNGILSENNTNALANSLRALMENKALRIELGKNAKTSMKSYAPDKIWAQWDALIRSSVSKENA